MMPDLKRKTMSFHRAVYVVENKDSIRLGACVIDAASKLKSPHERTIDRGGGSFIRLARIQIEEDKSIFLHLTSDTPGEPASVVSKVAPETNVIDVSTAPPPRNSEFMDGDAFLYIKGNDLCLCTTQMSISAIRYFLQELLKKSKIRKDSASFDLMHAADVGKLALVRRKGVKEIELNGALYSASYDYQKRTNEAVGALEKVSKHFKAFFKSPHDASDDGLQMRVTLKVDGRSKGLTLGSKRLEMIATNLIEQQVSDDEYVIVTKDGERIKPDEVYVRSTTEMDAAGKSVSRENAWTKLKEYYKILLGSGVLEQ